MDAMKIDQRCKANASAVLPPFCPPFGDFTKKGLRAIALSPLLFVLSEDRRKLPGQDLNLEWQDQNLQCYRLHHRAVWGGGILADTRLVSPGNFGGASRTFLVFNSARSGIQIQDGQNHGKMLIEPLPPLISQYSG